RARARSRARVLRDEPGEDRGSGRPDRALRRAGVTTEAPPSAPEWLPRFEEALENGDPLGASDTLRKSGVNGWVRKDHYDRAPVVAAKHAARTRRTEWAEPLLDLIEPALRDSDDYVRKSLGPFALGDQFVRSYPDATLARLRTWMEDRDENVRWNVAMTFSAASGSRVAQRAPDIL